MTATPDQIDQLLDAIDVDPGFALLLDICAARATPVHIVSDGFDACINRILGRPALQLLARLAESEIVSSSLRVDNGRWRATFEHPAEPCAHGCATCKPAAMARLGAGDGLVVFVGDGMSDRYAATCADVVFAKDKLAVFCDAESIPYTPFDTLAAVAESLARLLEADPQLPRSLSRKAFPVV